MRFQHSELNIDEYVCYFLIRFVQIQLKMFLNNLNQTSREAPTHLSPSDSTGPEVPSIIRPPIAEEGLSVTLAPKAGILVTCRELSNKARRASKECGVMGNT